MKLRIKGNSIRLRLSKSEVSTLSGEGYLIEETLFANNSFVYAIKKEDGIEEIKADLIDGKMTVYIPGILATEWPLNNVISLNNRKENETNNALYILIEKDFKCIDNTEEDQSDNYENPNAIC